MNDRPTLALIHGFSGSPASWWLLRPLLERQHDVRVAALPGHVEGEAVAPDAPVSMAWLADRLEAWLDAQGLEQAHLVGSSLGGWLALELAQRGRALSVTALSPAGGWERGSAEELALGAEALRTLRLARAVSPLAPLLVRSARLRRLLLGAATERAERVPAAMALRLVRDTVHCPIYLRLAEAIGRDGPPTFGEPSCPVLVAWGERDRIFPQGQFAPRLQAMLPDAEWVTLPEVGHASMYDDPEQVAQLVTCFIAGTAR